MVCTVGSVAGVDDMPYGLPRHEDGLFTYDGRWRVPLVFSFGMQVQRQRFLRGGNGRVTGAMQILPPPCSQQVC